MSLTVTQLPDGTYPMRTTSRRLGKPSIKPKSQTPGKTKGENCQRTPLKTWGIRVNPYKMSGADLDKYAKYCQVTSGLNK
jgi:hypothetical protein